MSSVQHQQNVMSNLSSGKVVSLHPIKFSWLVQIQNTRLRALIENDAAHIHPSPAKIDVINRASKCCISHREFAKHLKSASIFLAFEQVKWVNAENHQMYYRYYFENNTLRELAKNFRMASGQWKKTVERKITAINTLLQRPVAPQVLSAALQKIGIAMNAHQLQLVLKESASSNAASPYLSARNECEVLRRAIKVLDHKKILSQFSDYLSLVINASALSEGYVDALKIALHNPKHPLMKAVKSLRMQAERLHKKRAALLQQAESLNNTKLLCQIDKTVSILEAFPYQLLFRQQSALEKWANSSHVSDRLYREMTHLAPKRVLQNTQADRLFEKISGSPGVSRK